MPKQLYFLHTGESLTREETRTLLPWLMQVQTHFAATWGEDKDIRSIPSALVFARPLAGAFGGSGEAAVVWQFLESHFPGFNFQRGKDFEWGGTTLNVDRASVSRLLFAKEPPDFFLPLNYLFIVIRSEDTPLPKVSDAWIIQDPKGSLTSHQGSDSNSIDEPVNARERARMKFQEASDLYQKGQYDKSLDLLKELDKSFPDNNRILYAMAETYLNLGNIAMAQRLAVPLKEKFGDERATSLLSRIDETLTSSFEQKATTERTATISKELPDCIFCGTWKPGKFYYFYKCLEFTNPGSKVPSLVYYHRKDFERRNAWVCAECAKGISNARRNLIVLAFSFLVGVIVIVSTNPTHPLPAIGFLCLASLIFLLTIYLQHRSLLRQDSRFHSVRIEEKLVETVPGAKQEHGHGYWYPTFITDTQYRRDHSIWDYLCGSEVLKPPPQERSRWFQR